MKQSILRFCFFLLLITSPFESVFSAPPSNLPVCNGNNNNCVCPTPNGSQPFPGWKWTSVPPAGTTLTLTGVVWNSATQGGNSVVCIYNNSGQLSLSSTQYEPGWGFGDANFGWYERVSKGACEPGQSSTCSCNGPAQSCPMKFAPVMKK